MKKCLPLCSLVALMGVVALPHSACAQKVEADKKGNLIFTDAVGKRVPLIAGGGCSEPSLDPAKRRIVYVRATPGKMVSTGSGDGEATELWLVDIDGKTPAVLVRGEDNKDVARVLAEFHCPQFAPDGRTIYFLSSAWATSGAVHACNVSTKKVSFVCAGNALEVVPNGDYAGDLLVQQHRYFLGGGSYDWYWLLKPNGKEVGVVGETTEMFKDTYIESGR